MRSEFDFEEHWSADETADREIWYRIRAKREKRKRRRAVLLGAGCVFLAVIVAAGALFLMNGKDSSGKYAQDQLISAPIEWETFAEVCRGRGLRLPDPEKYFIDFVSATAYYFEEEMCAVEAKYRYNFDIDTELFMTDRAELDISFFSRELPVREWLLEGYTIQYQVQNDTYICYCSADQGRYYLKVPGSEADTINILKSIFGE